MFFVFLLLLPLKALTQLPVDNKFKIIANYSEVKHMSLSNRQAKHNSKDHNTTEYAGNNVNAWNDPAEAYRSPIVRQFCTKLICAITYLSEELGFLFPDFSVIPSTPPHLLSYPLGSPTEGFGTVSSQLLTRWLHILWKARNHYRLIWRLKPCCRTWGTQYSGSLIAYSNQHGDCSCFKILKRQDHAVFLQTRKEYFHLFLPSKS